MSPDLNRNGKRPPSSLDHSNPNPIHIHNHPFNHPILHHRLPLDPIPISSNSNPSKRLRTIPSTIDLSLPDHRPAIKKSLSGLIFPRPSHSHNPNTIDLLKPSTVPSPPKKPSPLLPIPTQTPSLSHHSPLPQLDNHNRSAREKQRNKDVLRREIVQWQEKYRLAIKSFVFYLDRLDPHTEHELGVKIQDWGARVDQFFSKDVTHVITDQPVPAALPGPSPTTHAAKRGATSAYQLPPAHPSPSRNKENGVPAGSRRPLKHRLEPDVQPPTDPAPAVNPLIRKALELKMKIWKSEKLLNVLCRLEDHRSPVKQVLKPSLPSLLLKEAQQGHTNEHDPVACRSDYYYFGPKALFIMVEDAVQEHKPIVIKEFSRPKTRDASSWPIMWGGTEGKSAFSRHSAKQSYMQVRNRIRTMYEQRARAFAQLSDASARLRSPGPPDDAPQLILPAQQNLRRAVSMNMLQRRQSVRLSRLAGRPLAELDEEDAGVIDHAHPGGADHQRGPGHVFLPASGNSVSATSAMPSAPSTRSSALRTPGPMGRMLVDKRLAALGKRPTFEMGGQPCGSALKRELAGLGGQKGRLESLKRETEESQFGGLKRSQSLDGAMMEQKKQQDQVLARRRSLIVGRGSSGGVGVGRKGLGVRAKLGNGYELVDLKRLVCSSNNNGGGRNGRGHHPHEEVAKAGYCENCRTKYPDFKRHIQARRHRRFALEETNWIELDMMLKRTTRRLKPNVRVPPSVREMIGVECGSEEEEEEEEEEEDEEVDEEVEEVDEEVEVEEEGGDIEDEEEEEGGDIEEEEEVRPESEDEEEEDEEAEEDDDQAHEEYADEAEEDDGCLHAHDKGLGLESEKKGADRESSRSGSERGGDNEEQDDQEEADRCRENETDKDEQCEYGGGADRHREEEEEAGRARLDVRKEDPGRGSSEGGEPEGFCDEPSTQAAQDLREGLDDYGHEGATDDGPRVDEDESEVEVGGAMAKGEREVELGSVEVKEVGGERGEEESGSAQVEVGEREANSVNVQLEEEFRQIWRVQQEAVAHAQGGDRCGSGMSTKSGLVGLAYGGSEGGGAYSQSESVVVELEEGEEVEESGQYHCWEPPHQQQGHRSHSQQHQHQHQQQQQQHQQQRMRFEWASGGGMEYQGTSEGFGLGMEDYSSDEGVEEGEVVEDSEMRRERRRRQRTETNGTNGTTTGTMSSGWGGSVGHHHHHSRHHSQPHQQQQRQRHRGVWVMDG